MTTYKIIRHHRDGPNQVIDTGYTLEEAQAYCSRDDTHGDGWFDGYDIENPSPAEIERRAWADGRLRAAVDAMRGLGI